MRCRPLATALFLLALHLLGLSVEGAAAQSAQPANQLEGFSVLIGSYMAMAAECNLPTAPLEEALDRIFRNKEVATSETARLKAVMMQSRTAFRGASKTYGCDEVERRIDDLLHPGAREASRARQCNARADENKREFDLALRAMRSSSPNAAAEAQKAVVNLCMSGSPERDAFNSVLAMLRGNHEK